MLVYQRVHQTVKSHAAFALEAHFELVQARWTPAGWMIVAGQELVQYCRPKNVLLERSHDSWSWIDAFLKGLQESTTSADGKTSNSASPRFQTHNFLNQSFLRPRKFTHWSVSKCGDPGLQIIYFGRSVDLSWSPGSGSLSVSETKPSPHFCGF